MMMGFTLPDLGTWQSKRRPTDALDAEIQNLLDRGEGARADAISQTMVEVEDRIAALVPTSPAGAAMQLRLLRQWAQVSNGTSPWTSLPTSCSPGWSASGDAPSRSSGQPQGSPA
jgi:hypothetical protein